MVPGVGFSSLGNPRRVAGRGAVPAHPPSRCRGAPFGSGPRQAHAGDAECDGDDGELRHRMRVAGQGAGDGLHPVGGAWAHRSVLHRPESVHHRHGDDDGAGGRDGVYVQGASAEPLRPAERVVRRGLGHDGRDAGERRRQRRPRTDGPVDGVVRAGAVGTQGQGEVQFPGASERDCGQLQQVAASVVVRGDARPCAKRGAGRCRVVACAGEAVLVAHGGCNAGRRTGLRHGRCGVHAGRPRAGEHGERDGTGSGGSEGGRRAGARGAERGDRLRGDAQPRSGGDGDGGLRDRGRDGGGGLGLHRHVRDPDVRAGGDGEDRPGGDPRRPDRRGAGGLPSEAVERVWCAHPGRQGGREDREHGPRAGGVVVAVRACGGGGGGGRAGRPHRPSGAGAVAAGRCGPVAVALVRAVGSGAGMAARATPALPASVRRATAPATRTTPRPASRTAPRAITTPSAPVGR